MSAEKIQRAVERLRETGVYMLVTADDHHTFTKADIRKPLAALIEALDKKYPRGKTISGPDIDVANALMALVDAVLGEGG